MPNKVYLSGAITGVPNYQKLFQEAEDQLVSAGYAVVNPAEIYPDARICGCYQENWIEHLGDDHSWLCNMRWDLVAMLEQCDKIALIEGFEGSRGVQVELQLALGLGFKYGTVEQWIERAK
jgi:hypothetical protein